MSTSSAPLVVLVDDRPATRGAAAWAAREAALRRTSVRLVTSDPVVPERELRDIARGGPTLVVGCGPSDVPELGPLLAAAAGPVVVVPSTCDPRRHGGEVVVAVDPAGDDDVRRRTLAVGAATASRWGRPLLVAVVGPAAHPDAATARRAFDACATEAGPHVAVHEVFGHGDPTVALVALVGPCTGLLVLGGLGRTGRAVVERARCPVAVVPPSARVTAPEGVRRSG
ncbi:hypothetical protein [Actinomycetospora chiangmaiensis]|uniref:hypothetical protein n=1 Tax=Actinomycetospora chiangmaiensis TaxID=402650 RepID=UPI00036D3B68|nr:hypothetical protein [Actinomycetospora chiangmaiensis]